MLGNQARLPGGRPDCHFEHVTARFSLLICLIKLSFSGWSLIPECVGRVPVSLWGSGGWGCVCSTLRFCSVSVRNRPQPSATVRNRPQPSATVRNRPQPSATVRNRPHDCYGRAYGKFCRGTGHFWRFQTFRCFVLRGRRGTLWHSDVFCNVSKIVLCGRRKTFATFSEDALQFSWQVQHFGRVQRHFAWQAQHFRRVVLRVFCESHWQGCVKWRQVANSVAGVAVCEMRWKLTEASHETSILRLQTLEVPTKTRRKTSILRLLVLVLPRVSSRVWLRRVYGGSRKTSPFRRFPSRLSCRFAWQAWHFVTFQPVW